MRLLVDVFRKYLKIILYIKYVGNYSLLFIGSSDSWTDGLLHMQSLCMFTTFFEAI